MELLVGISAAVVVGFDEGRVMVDVVVVDLRVLDGNDFVGDGIPNESGAGLVASIFGMVLLVWMSPVPPLASATRRIRCRRYGRPGAAGSI
jgi:hypothetical protein